MTLSLDDPQAKLQHVQSQLARISGKKVPHATYTMIQCPFHKDNSPSGRVSHDLAKPRSIGWFKCYACGDPMPWSLFSARLGLEGFGPPPPELDVPKTSFAHLDEDLLGSSDKLANEPLRFHKLNAQSQEYLGLSRQEWRGFSFDFLSSLGASCVYHRDKERFYVYLPVNVNGQLRGYIKANPRKPKDGPTYLNAPGTWSLDYGLFLFDQSLALMKRKGWTTMVLCEGPRDALRLLRDGIPAIALLGTRSWSTRKVRLLEMAGIEKIVICLDGDNAGYEAARFLFTGKPSKNSEKPTVAPLRESFDCEVFALWDYAVPDDFPDDKFDPGNMPASLVQKLKRLLS